MLKRTFLLGSLTTFLVQLVWKKLSQTLLDAEREVPAKLNLRSVIWNSHKLSSRKKPHVSFGSRWLPVGDLLSNADSSEVLVTSLHPRAYIERLWLQQINPSVGSSSAAPARRIQSTESTGDKQVKTIWANSWRYTNMSKHRVGWGQNRIKEWKQRSSTWTCENFPCQTHLAIQTKESRPESALNWLTCSFSEAKSWNRKAPAKWVCLKKYNAQNYGWIIIVETTMKLPFTQLSFFTVASSCFFIP